MAEEKRERFGKYLILDHLVDGGMAKICRAKFLGEQASKVVAIKMVQAQFSKDESFKTMFMDEVKLTFALLHPNIIQTYDYGMHKDQLFVAMEYCDGRNLKEYLDKLKQRKFVFPVEITVYIITQIAQGLHYAHTLTDKLTGKDTNIIHRDISPHNVMLTYEGSVKVIDFGIAKAESNSESTQAGTIKGKLSYLAPEYLEGMELDARYDLFAVGITMWEMLCSRKLFKAANDLAVLKKIQECKVPAPSTINPNVPKALDEIVLKTLSRDRTKRYDNMDQLNRALIKFLYSNYPDFNATDLQYFAKELFKEEIKRDREKLFEFGKIDLAPYLEEMKKESSGGRSEEVSFGGMSVDMSKKGKEVELDFGFEEENSATETRKKIRNTVVKDDKTAGKADLGSRLGASAKNFDETEKLTIGRTNTKRTKRGGINSKKKKESNGDEEATQTRSIKKKSRNKSLLIYAVAMLGAIAFFGKDHVEKYIIPGPEKSPASFVEAQREDNGFVVEEFQDTYIRLVNFDRHKQTVFIDGAKQDVDFMTRIKVEPGKEFVIRIQSPGLQHYVTSVSVEEGNEETLDIPKTKNENFSYLVTSRSCISGKLYFTLYGERRVESLPIKGSISFPAPSGRVPASETLFELIYERSGETLQRKTTISFSEIEETLDLCTKL